MKRGIEVRDEALLQRMAMEKEKCTGCKLCFRGCALLEGRGFSPKDLMEKMVLRKRVDGDFLYACAGCGYCTSVCPSHVDFSGIMKALKDHAYKRRKHVFYAMGGRVVDWHQKNGNRALFNHAEMTASTRALFFPGCALTAANPEGVERAWNHLKERDPSIGIWIGCCGNPSESVGQADRFESGLKKLDCFMKAQGIEELILACQNCFSVFKRHFPEVKASSLYEKIDLSRAAPFGGVLRRDRDTHWVLHDPCPIRKEPQIHEAVRRLIAGLQMPVKDLEANREATLCCGCGAMASVLKPLEAEKQRLKRLEQFGEASVVSYCQSCIDSFTGNGKQCRHLLDWIFETKGSARPNRGPLGRWINRYRMVRRVKKGEQSHEK